MNRFLLPIVSMLVATVLAGSAAADGTGSVTLHVTGLFSAEREADLRKVDEALEQISVGRIDFEMAEVEFSFDSKVDPFKNPDPEAVRATVDNLLRNASKHTFSALLPSQVPREKLELVEIGVSGLDCKACSYAAYRAIYQIEGVVRATASFKAGKVTALIDPEKIGRPALEEALKGKRVEVLATGAEE